MRGTTGGRVMLLTAAVAAVLTAGPAVRADDDSGAPAGGALLGSLDRETLRQRARAAGIVRVRGRAHLSGVVCAESVHVEPGAEVTVSGDTVVYSLGGIRIDAPIVGVVPPAAPHGPAKAGQGGFVGHVGGDAPSITFVCEQGDFLQSETILMVDGQPGSPAAVIGAAAIGGRGGAGGSIRIDCPGTVTILANVVPGRGGRGGDCRVTGAEGVLGGAGQSVSSACGGDGGPSGDVRIRAHKLVFELDQDGKPKGRIALRPGAEGGEAEAVGGRGGDAFACFRRAGRGGDAIARGGDPGRSTRAFVEVDELVPGDVDAHDIAGFLATEHPDGGRAFATGGHGGDAICYLETVDCPKRGRTGGRGGSGGAALAIGGGGGSGGQIGGGHGALRDRQQSAAETPPGKGGDAFATGGNAGFGAFGETAKTPGRGGPGGNGGDGEAHGGPGGSSVLGRRFDQPSVDGTGPLSGGAGGDAAALGGDGAGGGEGGSCCDRPGGRGAAGGRGGAGGKAKARPGRFGLGFTLGPFGNLLGQAAGRAGQAGAAGADCGPASAGSDIDVELTPDAASVELGQGIEFTAVVTNRGTTPYTGARVALYLQGFPIETQFVDVPAGGDVSVTFFVAPERDGYGQKVVIRVDAVTKATTTLDVKKPECLVDFSTTDIDFGPVIYGTQACRTFTVTNPSTTATVQVKFPPMPGTGEYFFDPLTGPQPHPLWPMLEPLETLEVEVCFTPGPPTFDQTFVICGQQFRLRGTAVYQ